METPWRYVAFLLLMAVVNDTLAVNVSFCSGSNTADESATYSQYQTNGLCSDSCGSDYAFAITQGSNCWCSDYAPENTVSTGSCNQKCPGYPYEYCGGNNGQFSYIELSKQPAGTIDGSSASSTKQTSQAPSSTRKTSAATASGSTTGDPTTEAVTGSPVTTIVTLPGQTQVSTVIITPTASADTSALGQGGSISPSSNGLSKAAVAGLAVGVALGVSILAGILVFFLWRRMKQQRKQNEAAMGPEMAIDGISGTPSSMSRHTSTMSQSGLLNKQPRINTRNLGSGWGSQGHSATSTASPTGTGNRRPIGADQRLDPYHAVYTNEDLRHSDVSLQDNTDYSRKILSVRNRGDGEIDDD